MSTGEIGYVQAKKYSLEVWHPASGAGSRSARARTPRLPGAADGHRYRPEVGAKPELVHTAQRLRLALARVVLAILETYQRPDGSVEVPEVLRRYMGRDEITVPAEAPQPRADPAAAARCPPPPTNIL